MQARSIGVGGATFLRSKDFLKLAYNKLNKHRVAPTHQPLVDHVIKK